AALTPRRWQRNKAASPRRRVTCRKRFARTKSRRKGRKALIRRTIHRNRILVIKASSRNRKTASRKRKISPATRRAKKAKTESPTKNRLTKRVIKASLEIKNRAIRRAAKKAAIQSLENKNLANRNRTARSLATTNQ